MHHLAAGIGEMVLEDSLSIETSPHHYAYDNYSEKFIVLTYSQSRRGYVEIHW